MARLYSATPDDVSIEEVETAIYTALTGLDCFAEPRNDDNVWFYAHRCNIPTLFFDNYSPELDHPFHEYESVEHTHLPATDVRSIRQFIAAIKS